MGEGLSVVVATRDRPRLLDRCLDSVAASLGPSDELIVADSSVATRAVAEIVARHAGRLISCPHGGASFQRNVGARAAGNGLLAFVDDDVRVSPGWAPAVVAAFEAHPEAGFITGRVEVPPEQEGYSRPVSIKADPEPAVLTPESQGTIGHSANLAVRRDAFEAITGFDEHLGPGTRLPAAEDGDLFDRLFAAGYTGRYEPAALAWHDQWRTRTDLVRLEWSYGIGTGARLAKLVRADRQRARALAGEDLWRNGIKILPSLVAEGYQFGVLFVLARVGGASVGYLRGRRMARC